MSLNCRTGHLGPLLALGDHRADLRPDQLLGPRESARDIAYLAS